MSEYNPPVDEMVFVLEQVVGLNDLPQAAELDDGMAEAILNEAGRLASQVLAPLNHSGDEQGSVLQDDGNVKTPDGFKEAYTQYRDTGWNGVPFNPEFGGQGLPWVLSFAVQEMWQSANMAFGLCPLLNQGAVDAIEAHGSDAQKALYLEKLISGEWTGTMNLTEPQAGSDLSAIKAKAVPQDDGSYKISGQKIFITYGEHDMADNIIHLVLARTPDAPEGTKGISLFIVPKFIPNAEGQAGDRNDVVCSKLEHKMGIHASPTCVMYFGEKDGAIGYLVGEENSGLKYMFTMMNNARLCVGLQGVAIAERAYQHALAYSKERTQGTSIKAKGGDRVAIFDHPDVQRMLLEMKSKIQAGRIMTYEAGLYLDKAKSGDDAAQARVNLLTPIVKAWCTDMAVEVASLGVQVHGGMGYIEETGAAQYMRDARILPIYEGTNGIQAMDLVYRKLLMDGGEGVNALIQEMESVSVDVSALKEATNYLLSKAGDPAACQAVCEPYLQGFGTVLGAHMLARAVAASSNADEKRCLSEFYDAYVLPSGIAALKTVNEQAVSVLQSSQAL